MIKFKTDRNSEGKIIHISVKGHSGYAKSGSDIVCAAVSGAVWMTLNGIEKQNLAKLDYKQSDGFTECTVSECRSEGADALLESLEIYISELSKQYGNYLKAE